MEPNRLNQALNERQPPPHPASGFQIEGAVPVKNVLCGQGRLFTGNVTVLSPLTGEGMVVWPNGSWFIGPIFFGVLQQGWIGGPYSPIPQQFPFQTKPLNPQYESFASSPQDTDFESNSSMGSPIEIIPGDNEPVGVDPRIVTPEFI